MKVLALIESADHVCYRYRFNAMAWALAQEGLVLEALPLPKGLGRISTLLAGRRAEIVVLQRKLLPAWQLAILRRNAKCLVYDIDDALFRRDSFTQKEQQSPSRLLRFRRIVRAADAVLAGNEYLAQFAAAYADPGRVHYVPTCVEPSWYPLASHRRTGSWARLAWIGLRSMLPSLDAMNEHLAAVGRRLPDISLRVISDALPQVSGPADGTSPLVVGHRDQRTGCHGHRHQLALRRPVGPGQMRSEGPAIHGRRTAGGGQCGGRSSENDRTRPIRIPGRYAGRMGRGRFPPGGKSVASPPHGRRRPPAASKSTTTSVAGVRRWPGCCGNWSTSRRRAASLARTVNPAICNHGPGTDAESATAAFGSSGTSPYNRSCDGSVPLWRVRPE